MISRSISEGAMGFSFEVYATKAGRYMIGKPGGYAIGHHYETRALALEVFPNLS